MTGGMRAWGCSHPASGMRDTCEDRSSPARRGSQASMARNGLPRSGATMRWRHGHKRIPEPIAARTRHAHHYRDRCPASPAGELQPGSGHRRRGTCDRSLRLAIRPRQRRKPKLLQKRVVLRGRFPNPELVEGCQREGRPNSLYGSSS